MKKLLTLLAVLMLAGGTVIAKPEQTLDVLPLMSSQSAQANRLWVGTFQLVWNDLMDGIVKGPVKFEDYKSPLAKQLNKQKFTAEQLSDDSYYKTYGETSPELKAQIETAIKEKFNETSDVLDSIDWTPGAGKYLVYAMLKKDFKLTSGNLILIALLKVGFTTTELMFTFDCEMNSIFTKKRRLRESLNLDTTDKLEEFITLY